jgi:hypothetical protein
MAANIEDDVSEPADQRRSDEKQGKSRTQLFVGKISHKTQILWKIPKTSRKTRILARNSPDPI